MKEGFDIITEEDQKEEVERKNERAACNNANSFDNDEDTDRDSSDNDSDTDG